MDPMSTVGFILSPFVDCVDGLTHERTYARTPAGLPYYKITVCAFGSGELIKRTRKSFATGRFMIKVKTEIH